MSTEYKMSIETVVGEMGEGEVYSCTDEIIFACIRGGSFKLDGFAYEITINPREGWVINDYPVMGMKHLIKVIDNLIQNHAALYKLSYTDIGNKLHDIKDTLDRTELESAMSTAGWCYAMAFYNVERDENVDMSDILTTYMAFYNLNIFEEWR